MIKKVIKSFIQPAPVVRKTENTVEIRNMKKFDVQKFVVDLSQQHWESAYFFAETPNGKWNIWKKLFLEVLDKHAPPHTRDKLKR